MNQVSVVHILDSHHGLVEEFEGLDFIESLEFVEIVEEVAMFCKIENEVDKVSMFEHFVESDDIFVLESTVDEYLFPQVFFIDFSEICYSVNLHIKKWLHKIPTVKKV